MTSSIPTSEFIPKFRNFGYRTSIVAEFALSWFTSVAEGSEVVAEVAKTSGKPLSPDCISAKPVTKERAIAPRRRPVPRIGGDKLREQNSGDGVIGLITLNDPIIQASTFVRTVW